MEKITYRKTLDVHKNGTQFTLQGFQTADKMSRVIEISLMASGDAIDFPLEGIQAVMYVSTPSSETPSRIECDIKDNKVIYNVLPITEEGTTEMQLKLIETYPGTSVLYSPKFAVEVSKSDGDVNDSDNSEILTVFEKTIQKADNAYNKAMTSFALSADGIITITYRDGSTYESDFLKRINIGDNAALSESYAKGTSGVRQGEETDNAKYYSNVAKSEALNAKNIMSESRDVLDEVRLHGAYTVFSVNFDTGEAEYLNPAFTFSIDEGTGELNAVCKDTMFDGEVSTYVNQWIESASGQAFEDMLERLTETNSKATNNESNIKKLFDADEGIESRTKQLEDRVTPIEKGGTGVSSIEAIRNVLGLDTYQKPWDFNGDVGKINIDSTLQLFDVSENGTEFTTPSIPIINNGKIILKFSVKGSGNDEGTGIYDFIYDYVKVFKSGVIIFEESFSNTNAYGEKNYRLPINVAKGDGIWITVKGHTFGKDDSYTQISRCEIKDVGIYANIDTPYKYYTIFEQYETISMDDYNA